MKKKAESIRKGDRILFEGAWHHVIVTDPIPPGPATSDAWTVLLSRRANAKTGDLVWIDPDAEVEVQEVTT